MSLTVNQHHSAHSPSDLRAELTRLFGHRQFQGAQEAVISQVMAGVDTVAVMPTGAGKSAIYQVAGLRVTDRSGGRLTLGRALVRAVLCLAFPAGLLWILVSRRNASVQDLLVGTVVVYDWSYHPADEPSPSGDAARSPSPAPRADGA